MYQYTCLQIHNDYLIAGGETMSAKLIAQALEKNGIHVIQYYRSNAEIQGGKLNKLLSGMQSIYSKRTYSEIESILRENTVDFALIHNTSPLISNSAYAVLEKHGIPVIKYIQNYNLLCLNGALDHGEACKKCREHLSVGVREKCYKKSAAYSLLKMKMKLDLDRKYLAQIRGFISISDFVRQTHIDYGIPAEKLHTIYHFIDSSLGLENQYNVPEDGQYAVYMGRLSEEKGLFTLLRAFEQTPQIPLKIMGSGGIEAELRRFVEEKGMRNVEFMGFCAGEKKKTLLSNARMMIVPSEWDEPFGRIVIESYQHGTPVIVSNRGGLPELVQPGSTGDIFQCGDSQDLVRCMNRLWDTPREQYRQMRECCIRTVEDRFTENAYIRNFKAVLASILRKL